LFLLKSIPTPIILATQEAETGGSWFEASPSKIVDERPCLEKTNHKKGLVEWLKV
jgi:hypothetical protein